MSKTFIIFDETLREGMHPLSHQMTPEQMAGLAAELDKTGVEVIQFGHGNGLGGSSCQYGFSPGDDVAYIKAVTAAVSRADLSVITLPGVGTRFQLRAAADHGVKYARFVTQVTEADISEQHIRMANSLGMVAIGGLTSANHTIVTPEELLRQARLLESYGAQGVYLLDGGGYLLPHQVHERVEVLVKGLGIPVGFHGHNNLSLGVADTMAAMEAGAYYIDASAKGFGAGAGNCPTEALLAVAQRMGWRTGADLYKMMDFGEQHIKPLMKSPMELENDQIMLGLSGVYSSFLLFARRAGGKFGVDSRDIIREIGRRTCTEGQEHICIEAAYSLRK
ncbi:MAG: 4-hydroxy-2-oxovalerate aldolase [Syntrophobacter sp.]